MSQMQVECIRIKIKPESLPRVREWALHLKSKDPEVRELLLAEGMAVESAFLETGTDGSNYLIYYLRAADLAETKRRSRVSTHPIDLFHREVMREVAVESASLECLVDFGP